MAVAVAAGSVSKEDRGRVLVVGGSTQVSGGVMLAATAAAPVTYSLV